MADGIGKIIWTFEACEVRNSDHHRWLLCPECQGYTSQSSM